MKQLTRRELGMALPALALLGGVMAEAGPAIGATEEERLTHSASSPFADLPMHASGNGGASRPVVRGTLATGEFVEVHETLLPAGQMPHPPHRHTHSEFLLIREGKLEVMSDGKQGVVGPGGVIFTASGVLHSLKNIGEVPANYFVVAIGVQKALP
jgi:mannose-6-phosphate isomerase-like protein (cupin superfamily)